MKKMKYVDERKWNESERQIIMIEMIVIINDQWHQYENDKAEADSENEKQ